MQALQAAPDIHQVWVSPGWCDVNGHLNAARFAEIFDAAAWRLLAELTDSAREADTELSWADVRHDTRFLSEIAGGETVTVKALVRGSGRTSVTTVFGLFTESQAKPSAVCTMVSVRFSRQSRTSVELGPELKKAVDAAKPQHLDDGGQI